jgi:hypothetical protein
MGSSRDSIGVVCMIFAVLLLIVAVIIFIPEVWGRLQDSVAERAYARAEELRQQVALTDAETKQQESKQEQFRMGLQIYAVTLAAFTHSNSVEICIGAGGMLFVLLALAWFRERFQL